VGGAKTKKLRVGMLTPDQSKQLIAGRKECRKTLVTLKKAITALIKKRCKGKNNDNCKLRHLKTCEENIWFLESILDPPEDGADSPVSEENYRYHFIFSVPQKSKFNKQEKDAIKSMSEKFEQKQTAGTIDLFVNLMITTGLELYVSSQTELLKFLRFISNLPPLTTELQSKVIVNTTLRCPWIVLSLLYLNCHLLLLIFGYGKLDLSASTLLLPKVSGMVGKAIEYICGCFPEITENDKRRGNNVEILLEMLWVLLMAQRYVEALPLNFPSNLEKETLYTLANFSTFTLKGKDMKDQAKLGMASHRCQLWLLCDFELSQFLKRPRQSNLLSKLRVGTEGSRRSARGRNKEPDSAVTPVSTQSDLSKLPVGTKGRRSRGRREPDAPVSTQMDSQCCDCQESKCEVECPCVVADEKCTNCAPQGYLCLNPNGYSPLLVIKRRALATEVPDVSNKKTKLESGDAKKHALILQTAEKERVEREKEQKEREQDRAERERDREERKKEKEERAEKKEQAKKAKEKKAKEDEEKKAKEDKEKKAKEDKERKAKEDKERKAKEDEENAKEQQKKPLEKQENQINEEKEKKSNKKQAKKERKEKKKRKKIEKERKKAVDQRKEKSTPHKAVEPESSDSDSSDSELDGNVQPSSKKSKQNEELTQFLSVIPTLTNQVNELCRTGAEWKEANRRTLEKAKETTAFDAIQQVVTLARVLSPSPMISSPTFLPNGNSSYGQTQYLPYNFGR
jgi:hypothetical protein